MLFGASTPLVQHFGVGVGPFSTAALLYAGATLAGAVLRRPADREAGVTRADLPRLLALAALGAVAGPVALAWGLQRTSGTSASLVLTSEAVFTALFALLLYREEIGGRVALAMALLAAGGAVLAVEQGRLGGSSLLGILAVALAAAAWGLDNALSRRLAERDPGQVVFLKAILGASAAGTIAMVVGEPLPRPGALLGLLLVGATGYGLSLRFYLLAQRAFGAARTGSVFAFAPFFGAGLALALGERSAGWPTLAGALLMLTGVVLHLFERHDHGHVHEAMTHEHAHRHDDAHHAHGHAEMPAGGTHSHPHRHDPLEHRHPHVPDAHHGHRH